MLSHRGSTETCNADFPHSLPEYLQNATRQVCLIEAGLVAVDSVVSRSHYLVLTLIAREVRSAMIEETGIAHVIDSCKESNVYRALTTALTEGGARLRYGRSVGVTETWISANIMGDGIHQTQALRLAESGLGNHTSAPKVHSRPSKMHSWAMV